VKYRGGKPRGFTHTVCEQPLRAITPIKELRQFRFRPWWGGAISPPSRNTSEFPEQRPQMHSGKRITDN